MVGLKSHHNPGPHPTAVRHKSSGGHSVPQHRVSWCFVENNLNQQGLCDSPGASLHAEIVIYDLGNC